MALRKGIPSARPWTYHASMSGGVYTETQRHNRCPQEPPVRVNLGTPFPRTPSLAPSSGQEAPPQGPVVWGLNRP